MAGKGRQTARKPATKFAHLRKKMEKNRIMAKIGKRREIAARSAAAALICKIRRRPLASLHRLVLRRGFPRKHDPASGERYFGQSVPKPVRIAARRGPVVIDGQRPVGNVQLGRRLRPGGPRWPVRASADKAVVVLGLGILVMALLLARHLESYMAATSDEELLTVLLLLYPKTRTPFSTRWPSIGKASSLAISSSRTSGPWFFTTFRKSEFICTPTRTSRTTCPRNPKCRWPSNMNSRGSWARWSCSFETTRARSSSPSYWTTSEADNFGHAGK